MTDTQEIEQSITLKLREALTSLGLKKENKKFIAYINSDETILNFQLIYNELLGQYIHSEIKKEFYNELKELEKDSYIQAEEIKLKKLLSNLVPLMCSFTIEERFFLKLPERNSMEFIYNTISKNVICKYDVDYIWNAVRIRLN